MDYQNLYLTLATNDGSPVEMQVEHPRTMMITYPISSRYPSAYIHGGFYGLNRIQSRYTVPCSEQAVATSMWLVENFEENLLTTVPRSVMYQVNKQTVSTLGRFVRDESVSQIDSLHRIMLTFARRAV